MWLPLAPRMLWVARCHEGGGVVAGGSCCSVLFGGAGVAGARAVWRWSAAQGLRALGCFVDAGWQDSRAVHDSRGPCSEKCPFLARSSRGVFPSGCLQGFSDAWRAYPAKASSFRMHGARILPRRGDFPVRDRFRDAWSAKLAMDRRPRTHRGGILPRQDPWERTAREYCHCQSGQERIRAQSCHRRAPRAPMCHGSRSAHAPWLRTPPPFAYATRHPDAAGLRVLQAVRALAVAQPADCRVAAERVVNIAKLVSVPQRRSATTPCATMSCAAAPQRHALQHRVAMHHDAMRRTRPFCRR